jgi:hypothetical protein
MSPQVAAAIWLYTRIGPYEQSGPIGKLTFGPVAFDHGRGGGLLLSFDYQPAKDIDQDRWLRLDIQIRSRRTSAPRRYGTASVNWRVHPRLSPTVGGPIEVNWILLPEDIEQIELDHGIDTAAGAPWEFQVMVEGLSSGPSGVVATAGDGTLTIAGSDWQNLMQQAGYGLGPGARSALSQSTHDHPTWLEAEKRLARARERLRAGEGRTALEECLSQFEALASLPYRPDSWRGRWAVPPQKDAGLVAALAGHCAYLNKIGHHRDSKADPASREYSQMPLDQWEAELAVAASHHYLAYVLRLDAVARPPSKPTT